MRTVSFKSVYDGVLQRLGLDPLGDAITQDTARAIAKHITTRASNIWTMWDWPDLTITEERAYRAPWYFEAQYDQNDEVYYVANETYYKVKPGEHPPIGSNPPADTLNWEVLTPVTPLVARDQPGRLPIGKVFGVYKSDPSLNGNGCCDPQELGLRFRPTEKGTWVSCGPGTTVWVCYSLPPPVYTMVPWILGKYYVPGSRVFWRGLGYPYPLDYPGFGEVYRCLAVTNAQPPSDTLFWAREPVPDFFNVYFEAGAAADCLREGPATADDQSRFARASAFDNEADRFVEAVIDDLLAQGQKHTYYKPRPCWDGWILSEPWLGSETVPLLPVFTGLAAPDVPVGLPPSATLIYRPEIVSLTGPEPSLHSFPTISYPTDTLLIITVDTEEQSWRLDPGPANGADPGQLSPADYNVVNNNKHWTLVSVTATGGPGGADDETAGVTPLINGQDYVDVTFATPLADTAWTLIGCSIVNTVDTSVLNIMPGTVTAKMVNGFRLQLSALPDSDNYRLNWEVKGTPGVPLVPATTYTLAGPSSGTVSVPSTNFTVALPAGTSVASPVTVTPSDGGGGGTFAPTSVTLTTAAPSATFTYTPASTGTKTISTTNDGGLTNPANRSYVSNASTAATTYSLTGPSSGTVSVASTNFTVALPGGSTVAAPVTITPHDGGAGGTFAPTTVNLTTGAPSATFTYTPSVTGAKTISTTNSSTLTNPASLTYTVSAGAGIADGDPVSTWPDSSGHGHTATQTGSARPIYKTGILGGKPVVRFSVVGASGMNLATAISGNAPFEMFMVAKSVSTAQSLYSLAPSTSNGALGFLQLGGGSPAIFIESKSGYGYMGSNPYAGAFHIFNAAIDVSTAALLIDGAGVGLPFASLADTGDLDNLGYRAHDSTYSDGDIAEIIFFNVILSAPNLRNQIAQFLSDKYSMGLAFGVGSTDPETVSGLVAHWKADAIT